MIIVLLSSRTVSIFGENDSNEQTDKTVCEILETQVGMHWKYQMLPSVISNPAKFDSCTVLKERDLTKWLNVNLWPVYLTDVKSFQIRDTLPFAICEVAKKHSKLDVSPQ